MVGLPSIRQQGLGDEESPLTLITRNRWLDCQWQLAPALLGTCIDARIRKGSLVAFLNPEIRGLEVFQQAAMRNCCSRD